MSYKLQNPLSAFNNQNQNDKNPLDSLETGLLRAGFATKMRQGSVFRQDLPAVCSERSTVVQG